MDSIPLKAAETTNRHERNSSEFGRLGELIQAILREDCAWSDAPSKAFAGEGKRLRNMPPCMPLRRHEIITSLSMVGVLASTCSLFMWMIWNRFVESAVGSYHYFFF